jgi:hypothetical protein
MIDEVPIKQFVSLPLGRIHELTDVEMAEEESLAGRSTIKLSIRPMN